MSTRQPLRFLHQAYPGNHAITESRCPQCCVLVAAGADDKYLAIAEAVHKCRIINAPRLTGADFTHLR